MHSGTAGSARSVIPTIFIVGGPRCGTTSLAAYLAQHPQVFISNPKEPHHFGSDLDIRLRPYADRQKYLELFHEAGDRQQAGEGSVLYLYSKTAPEEIRDLSPGAKIIIMLRDPAEMVPSLHTHNLTLGYEDLPDLGQALAAEGERRQGRRISWTCLVPFALRYTVLGKFSEHVRRYLEVFGRDRVKCILLDDLKKDPERTYQETLAFLGLAPAPLPEFKAHNERQRWRSHHLGRAIRTTLRFVQHACRRLPTRIRKSVQSAFGIAFHLLARANLTKARMPFVSAEVRRQLRQVFRDDIDQLSRVLDRDLSSWREPEEQEAGVGSGAGRERLLKHRWRIDRNHLIGITAGQWRRLLRENEVDAAYWHRAALISVASILNSLASRKEERRYGREIDKTVIEHPPLFILGPWGTGATLLHNLFSRDPRLACPKIQEVIHPGSCLSKRDAADEPLEDEVALALSCLRSPDLALTFPRNSGRYQRYLTFEGVPTVEVEEWKRALLWFLKKLTLKHGRPLVLSSPPHTARIRLLLEMFPGARFVNIHREPYTVFRSWRHTHDTALWFMCLQKPELNRIDDRLLKMGRVLFEAYFHQHRLIPRGQHVDVAYADLEARPAEVMQEIYAKLGLPSFEELRPRLQAYVDSLRAYPKNELPQLAPEEREKVARAWRRAFEEWGYPLSAGTWPPGRSREPGCPSPVSS